MTWKTTVNQETHYCRALNVHNEIDEHNQSLFICRYIASRAEQFHTNFYARYQIILVGIVPTQICRAIPFNGDAKYSKHRLKSTSFTRITSPPPVPPNNSNKVHLKRIIIAIVRCVLGSVLCSETDRPPLPNRTILRRE